MSHDRQPHPSRPEAKHSHGTPLPSTCHACAESRGSSYPFRNGVRPWQNAVVRTVLVVFSASRARGRISSGWKLRSNEQTQIVAVPLGRFRMGASMSEDFRAEMARVLETSGKAALTRWSELLETGSRRKVRHECAFCHQVSDVEVEGLPDDELRHVVKFLTEATMAKPKDDAPAAPVNGWNVSDMTDLELDLMLARDMGDAELVAEAEVLKLTQEETVLWERITKKREGELQPHVGGAPADIALRREESSVTR